MERLNKIVKYWPAAIVLIIIAILFLFSLNIFSSSGKYLYVSQHGNDKNEGGSDKPLKTVQAAVNLALNFPDTKYTIKIFPGVYRETISITDTSDRKTTLKIQALNSNNEKVVLSGSEPSSDYKWNICTDNTCSQFPAVSRNHIYYASLDWTETPYFLVEKKDGGNEKQLFMAREPDYLVTTEWKYHENWWTASDSIKSNYSLVDKGNLSSLNQLEGASVFMMDGADRCGTFLYRKTVDKFNKNTAEVIFGSPVGFSIFGSQEKGIGPNTKYFIEGKSVFLNSPGEWFYDKEKNILYLWPLEEKNPSELSIEIPKRPYGIKITSGRNIELDGLTIKFINNTTQSINGAIIVNPDKEQFIENVTIKNTIVDYAGKGIILLTSDPSQHIQNVNISNSKISNILSNAVLGIAGNKAPSSISGITISGSEFSSSGHYFNDAAVNFIRTDNVKFVKNSVKDTGSYGVHFTSFEKSDGVTNDILIEKNIIRNTCQSASFCSALKFYGGKYQNTTAKNNIFTDNIGWSYCQEKASGRGHAHGVFISNASGVELNSNISLRNTDSAYHVYPRQIEANQNRFINNLGGYSNIGLDLANGENAHDADKNAIVTRHDDTIIKNNVFMANKIGLLIDSIHPDKITVDYNAYIDNINNTKVSNTSSNNWDKHFIITDKTAFNNAEKYNFNLAFLSVLRGRGEPRQSNPFLEFQLDFFGLGNDIGPCKFRWFGNSCPVLN